jgi:hypothetical protein
VNEATIRYGVKQLEEKGVISTFPALLGPEDRILLDCDGVGFGMKKWD